MKAKNRYLRKVTPSLANKFVGVKKSDSGVQKFNSEDLDIDAWKKHALEIDMMLCGPDEEK